MAHVRSVLKIAGALLAILVLGGCLQSEKTVTIRPDGSGVVEERFLMRSEFVQMIAGMSQEATGESFSLLDREQLREAASEMGSGVTFESVEPLETDWGQGYVARYTFEDIGELRINQNPGDNVPDQGSSQGPDMETTEYLQFSFQAGNPARLQIDMPEPTEVSDGEEEGESDSEGEIDPSQLSQIMQFYQDMRIALRFRFESAIVSTNASYRDGNTVTLMNIDFNEILQDQETARRIFSQESPSLAGAQDILSEYPGVQVEPQSSISVQFR